LDKRKKRYDETDQFLRDEASSLHEKIVSCEINLNHIEDGIYDLRRKLRWLGIYSSALLVEIQQSDLDKHYMIDHYITEENMSFKFNLLQKLKRMKKAFAFYRAGSMHLVN
jgi:hypothetical protein